MEILLTYLTKLTHASQEHASCGKKWKYRALAICPQEKLTQLQVAEKYIIPSQSALIKAFDESAVQIINTLLFRFVRLWSANYITCFITLFSAKGV